MNADSSGVWIFVFILSSFFFYFLFLSVPLYFPVLNSQRKKSSVSKIKRRRQWQPSPGQPGGLQSMGPLRVRHN